MLCCGVTSGGVRRSINLAMKSRFERPSYAADITTRFEYGQPVQNLYDSVRGNGPVAGTHSRERARVRESAPVAPTVLWSTSRP